MNVTVLPSVESVAVPTTLVEPSLSVIDQPLARDAVSVIDGLVVTPTFVAPAAGDRDSTAMLAGSRWKTTST